MGMGYVGLPLAQQAVRKGLDVIGLDTSRRVVEGLSAGVSHVDDLSDAEISEMLDGGFRATTDSSVVATADTVVICVPTPLGPAGGPDLGAVLSAGRAIGEHLTKGTLVVLESTTYPGTTDEVLRPVLEERSGLMAGEDFALAFSPERVDPGNQTFTIANTPKVVGGLTDQCGKQATAFYAQLVEQVVPARGTREAEMAKLLENTYRHVNIALVNEMARFSHELGIDFWNVIDLAATKPFGFQAFRPGPGVGGHCIPIDPNYLSHRVKEQLGYPFRFVELAQEINAGMPRYVVQRIQDLLNHDAIALRGAQVLLLGITYKPDIADQRETPAKPLAEQLLAQGASLSYHDLYVDDWEVEGARPVGGESLLEAAATADVVVLVQNHAGFDLRALAEAARRFLDLRGVVDEPGVERL
ncbi:MULTISPECIES: nucleotide sugar dehydrogenase [Mumia]|uniref:nucleotide sugar dehydrogenase n=1 Tax=Mumia TaxID=1546255 RepID=UPI001E392539|nr:MULTISPECIES: nucleotide sugar dehydrogenase [Mumia]